MGFDESSALSLDFEEINFAKNILGSDDKGSRVVNQNKNLNERPINFIPHQTKKLVRCAVY